MAGDNGTVCTSYDHVATNKILLRYDISYPVRYIVTTNSFVRVCLLQIIICMFLFCISMYTSFIIWYDNHRVHGHYFRIL